MKLDKELSALKRTNKILEYIIYAICLLVIILPYIPKFSFWAEKYVFADTTYNAAESMPDYDLSYDHLIIPSIVVDRKIVEADNMKQVHENVWRRPRGSTPDKGSNTVLVAHRYATIGGNRASTFYNLPELVNGDKIYVAWQGKLYTYEVYETDTVEPTAIEIEDPTADPILTLYTCTPLWTASHRFVVRARLITQ